MREYELIWILGGNVSDADGAESIEKVKTLVSEHGGEVQQAEPWGRRTLSYPIRNYREGSYYLARFSADGNRAMDIERAVQSDQSVIRHLMVRADSNGAAGAAQASEATGDSTPEPVAAEPVDAEPVDSQTED
ncbi:MAG: 30S ribosomal protein S6 [Dehalococcoidia bacterium]